MEKRVILAIVICAGIMFAWAKFFPGTPPETAPGGAACRHRAGGTDDRRRGRAHPFGNGGPAAAGLDEAQRPLRSRSRRPSSTRRCSVSSSRIAARC